MPVEFTILIVYYQLPIDQISAVFENDVCLFEMVEENLLAKLVRLGEKRCCFYFSKYDWERDGTGDRRRSHGRIILRPDEVSYGGSS